MKIAFIGGGNMGEAILVAVLEKGLSTPGDICVGDINEERRQQLKSHYGVAVTDSNKEAIVNKDVVIFAVKPQNLSEVLSNLKGCLQLNQLILSIVAGVKLDKLCQGLGHNRVVRAMPNTPAKVGYGMSVWTGAIEVTEEQKIQARAILGAMGREIYFQDEEYLDMVTAVSASGPAYFFLLAEALVGAAVRIGLPQREAEELVSQTMLGSAYLIQKSDKAVAELRQDVTSRGGTTERALQVFEEGGFAGLVNEAVKAAYKRARELGN